MSPTISERSFEEAIECGLLQHGHRQALPDLSALPAARLRPPAGGGRARGGSRAALSDSALGRQREELHHCLARPSARDAPRRERPSRLRLDHRHHRPTHPRPPAPDHDASVRAAARGGGEHRQDVAPAQGGARVGEDDHRDHAPEVPRDREGDRRAAREALRRDRRRGALVAVGREHEAAQGDPGDHRSDRSGAGGGRIGRRRRGGQSRPRRSGEARQLPESLALRLHRHAEAEDPRALRHEARRRKIRALPPLHHAPGDRGGPHPRRAGELLHLQAYWRLLKKIEDDPRYDKKKAAYLLKAFVELHPHAIREKVRIMVEHFAAKVQGEIGGKAKAMIVTRSQLHAVHYKRAVDEHLAERGYPFKALVAFSGTVQEGGRSYTESGMNGVPETQTAGTFERPEYRFLIVANKFQTGFDQPLLHTMYVDKKLGGVNAVQTLSRLNRTHAEKKGTTVLDFANEADEIKAAFEPYYETTLLSEATDPNLLYEIQTRLAAFPVYTDADVDAFAKVYFDTKATQDRLYAVLTPVVDHFRGLSEEEQQDFRGQLTDYVRLYAFLAQVLTFADADLEKLYVFARYLRRLLPADRAELPREVQQNIDMESYRIQQTGSGKITLERNAGMLTPVSTKGAYGAAPEELETLSRIIADLNERFGLNLGPEHRVTLGQMMEKLDDDAALDAAARANTRENVRLTFDQKVEHVIQDIVDSNFDLYRRITDDPAFGEAVKNFLFDQYLRAHRNAEELIKRGESKTLEFKSTLRWSRKEDRQDDKGVTHAVLKTIAAFLNTEGGDILIGVTDDGSVAGIESDRLENDDKFMRHLAQVVRNGLGDRASTCIDPKTQVVQGKTVCVVSCQRSPEPVFLRWKGMETTPDGDFYVRSGPGTVKLPPDSASEYIRTRFTAAVAASRARSDGTV